MYKNELFLRWLMKALVEKFYDCFKFLLKEKKNG